MAITVLTPADHQLRLEKDEDYVYRGYIVRRGDNGYHVYLPTRTAQDVVEENDDGWGISLLDAMLVVNELVDESPRRKHK